jgi:hypothetical protein
VGAIVVAAVAGAWVWRSTRASEPQGPLAPPAGSRSIELIPADLGERVSFGVLLPPNAGGDPVTLESVNVDLPDGMSLIGSSVQVASENGHFVSSARGYPPAGIEVHPVHGFTISGHENQSSTGLLLGVTAERTGVLSLPNVSLMYSVAGHSYVADYEQGATLCVPADSFPAGCPSQLEPTAQ